MRTSRAEFDVTPGRMQNEVFPGNLLQHHRPLFLRTYPVVLLITTWKYLGIEAVSQLAGP